MHLAVDAGEGTAAIVYCKVGKGAALLTGPHPEFVFLGKPADDWVLTKPRFAAANLEEKHGSPWIFRRDQSACQRREASY